MIRRFFIPGAIAAAITVAAPGPMAVSAPVIPDVITNTDRNGVTRVDLARANDNTAIYYDSSLTEAQFLARAEKDAVALGLPFVKTLATGRVLIVRGSEKQVAGCLASTEGIPATRVGPSYHINSEQTTRALSAFTNRLMIRFHDDAREADKEAFYVANHLRRVKEYGSGDVIVESDNQPDARMIGFARDLASHGDMVESASSELLMTGELTANSDSIEINDPLFDFQWYLFNSVANTNNGTGAADEDLDVPRAWMINQRNLRDAPGTSANGIFGDSDIVVGIFDSGIQIAHEDLAESIDPNVGFSAIGGQPINSGGGVLAAHGTFMAGLVGAAKNNVGTIGVAPGVKLYSLKIFATDLSTSTVSLSQAIDASVSAGVDVNVHPYSLVLSDTNSNTVVIEDSLRRSFESGRGGLGTSNFASAGNFQAQVEYPAHSQWAIAVGSVSSDGLASDGDGAFQPERTGIPRHNWGGKGIDFVMPSYAYTYGATGSQSGGYLPSSTTGIVSTDLTATSGVANPNPNLVGNESGNSAAIGLVLGLNDSSAVTGSNAKLYKGTSVAAALAGGVAGLLLSDERYVSLPPFIHLDNDDTRQSRRGRAPLRGQENFDNLLSRMKNFSDLPNGNNLSYIDQYSEFGGFGRPNPARALSLPNNGANVTPDSAYRSMLEAAPIYEVAFDGTGVAGDNETEEAVDTLAKGWTVLNGVDASLSSNGPAVTISPYLEGITSYQEEGQSPTTAEFDEEGNLHYLYVWTDSVTTAPQGSGTSTAAENLVYNPDGRYLSNRKISIQSPLITPATTGVPMVLDVKVGHELGAENSSSDGLHAPDDRIAAISSELDTIKFYIDPVPPDDQSPDLDPFVVGTITGDSASESKIRLTPANVVEVTTSGSTKYFPQWPGPPSGTYTPYIDPGQMLVRNYSFYVSAIPEGYSFRIIMEMASGASYLPSYTTQGTSPVTFTQLHNVHRDMQGFIFTGAKITAVRSDYLDFLRRDIFEIADGQFPTWSASGNDVMMARLGFFGTDSFLVQADPRHEYLTDPSSLSSASARPNITLTNTNGGELITGLAAHPKQELLVMTTSSDAGQFISTITNDGVNQRQIIDSSLTVGARDASWSTNGQQIVYCSPSYIRIANLQEDDTWNVETVLSTDLVSTFLEDFHSPAFDSSSGVVYFTARRRDQAATDTSLKIYLATRTGRIISFNPDPRNTSAPGFEDIDIFDLNISPTGRRLIFSANASSAPTFDIDGNLIDPAVASSACRLFTIENFYNVVNFGDVPHYEMIVLSGTDVNFEKVSARWARISPDLNEIVWQAFNVPVDINTPAANGRIVRQPIGLGNEFNGPPDNEPSPLPPPTVTPVGTPPPSDIAHVTYSGGYDFVFDQQGWEFRNAAPVYDVPTNSYENVDLFPAEIRPGLVAFTASSENSITGNGVHVATLNFNALQQGSSPLTFLLSSPNRTRAQDINGMDFAITTENGNVNIGSRGPSVRIYLSPSSPSLSVGQPLSVDVMMDTNGQAVNDLQVYLSFNNSTLRFTSGMVNGTEFERVRGQGRITLKANSLNTFGYAESATSVLSVQPDSMYLYRAYISATEGVDPDRVPSVRLRVNSLNLESSFSSEVNSRGDLSMSPNSNGPKALDLLFQPPPEIFTLPLGKRRYTLAVDLLNFTAGDDPNGGIILSGVEIYRLDNAATKTVIKNPQTIFSTEFDTPADRAKFTNGPFIPEFTPPEFLAYPSSLAMRVLNKTNTFGFWTADGNAIPAGAITIDDAAPTVIFRATYVIKNEQEANPLRVPDYRLRLATNDFQRSAASSVITVNDGVTAPVPGKSRTVYVFLVLEEVPADFNAFVAAFDVLSFYPGRDITDKPLEVESLKIDRVYIPGYPSPR
ncbi:S8 family serine peptidase [Candidatus Sumerlaeota bacterium]|nr:S8 family serine peptidase [Candidatus Sumerlaeota bacterium]